jgi:hypothetical protein
VNLDKKETRHNEEEVHKSNRECKNEREREREGQKTSKQSTLPRKSVQEKR